jgi:hypothetical protein
MNKFEIGICIFCAGGVLDMLSMFIYFNYYISTKILTVTIIIGLIMITSGIVIVLDDL